MSRIFSKNIKQAPVKTKATGVTGGSIKIAFNDKLKIVIT